MSNFQEKSYLTLEWPKNVYKTKMEFLVRNTLVKERNVYGVDSQRAIHRPERNYSILEGRGGSSSQGSGNGLLLAENVHWTNNWGNIISPSTYG